MRFASLRKMVKKTTADFKSFVAFDFETTGLGADERITEIGAVKVIDGFMVARYSSLTDPQKPIDPRITKITGITNEMVAGKPTAEQLMPSFDAFTEGLPLVAHNASFDCRFLDQAAKRAGCYFDQEIFDTLLYAKRILPELSSHKLPSLCRLLGITQSSAHRAWCDAEAAARLYMILRSKDTSLK